MNFYICYTAYFTFELSLNLQLKIKKKRERGIFKHYLYMLFKTIVHRLDNIAP